MLLFVPVFLCLLPVPPLPPPSSSCLLVPAKKRTKKTKMKNFEKYVSHGKSIFSVFAVSAKLYVIPPDPEQKLASIELCVHSNTDMFVACVEDLRLFLHCAYPSVSA